MALRIIKTEDGSESLFDENLNETYHSTKGAKGESEYVFIEQGLNFLTSLRLNNQQPISILEVGFGTGLNALLTWQWAENGKTTVHFYSLEPYPIPEDVRNEMDLKSDIRFNLLHEADWNRAVRMSDYFTIEKRIKGLEEMNKLDAFDVIFFDAFAPSKQPEIWSADNLLKCYGSLKSGGILTTYCAQGEFKRNLKYVGFEVEVLPGALGKKEMVRGRKN